MLEVLKKLMRDDSGQDLAEYGIALAVIAIGAAIAAIAIAGSVSELWSSASDAMSTVMASL